MTGSVTVTVLFFAAARDAVRLDSTAITSPGPLDGNRLLELLCERFPALAAHRALLRLAVNEEYAEPDRLLADGDEVALIPPVCGG